MWCKAVTLVEPNFKQNVAPVSNSAWTVVVKIECWPESSCSEVHVSSCDVFLS